MSEENIFQAQKATTSVGRARVALQGEELREQSRLSCSCVTNITDTPPPHPRENIFFSRKVGENQALKSLLPGMSLLPLNNLADFSSGVKNCSSAEQHQSQRETEGQQQFDFYLLVLLINYYCSTSVRLAIDTTHS